MPLLRNNDYYVWGNIFNLNYSQMLNDALNKELKLKRLKAVVQQNTVKGLK